MSEVKEIEKKMVDFKFENGQMILTVDPDKNGVPVISLAVNVAEIPNEVIAAFVKD